MRVTQVVSCSKGRQTRIGLNHKEVRCPHVTDDCKAVRSRQPRRGLAEHNIASDLLLFIKLYSL